MNCGRLMLMHRSDWQGEKMRLKGLKRREVQKLVVSMGGFRATVLMKEVGLGFFGEGGRAKQAILRFDSGDAIPEHAPFRSNAMIRTQQSIWFEQKQGGSFTEQAPMLINKVSSLLGLFPVALIELSTVTQFLVNGMWRTPVELLDDEMKLNNQVIKRFRAKAEIPLALSKTGTIHLCCEGELVIKNSSIEFDPRGAMIEKETGIETSADEWFLAEALFRFNQQIMHRMSETTDQLPLKVNTRYRPAGNAESILHYDSFAAIGPICGNDIIRWILRAALDCGVTFSLADLNDLGITLSGSGCVINT